MTYFSNSTLKDFFSYVFLSDKLPPRWSNRLMSINPQEVLFEMRLPYITRNESIQKAFRKYLANRKTPLELRALCWHGMMANARAAVPNESAVQTDFIDLPAVAAEYRKRHLKDWQDISLLTSPNLRKSLPKCFDEAIDKDSPELFEVIKDLTDYRLSTNAVSYLMANYPHKTSLIQHLLRQNDSRPFLRTILYHTCSSLSPDLACNVIDFITQRYPLLVSSTTDYLGNNLLWYSLHQANRLTCPHTVSRLTQSLIAYGSSPDDRNHLGLSYSDIARWEPALPELPPPAQQPSYLVFDLSHGSARQSFPCRTTDTPPDPRHAACKTTELWLKYIPAGIFRMGNSNRTEEHLYQQINEHDVAITHGFYIGVFPVTCKQWQLVTGDDIYFKSEDHMPCRNRSQAWFQAVQNRFLACLKAKSGRDFTLPTEAQWEYSCKGTEQWHPDKHESYAWTETNSGHAVHPVGQKKPNPQGLYDTIGNCWELCKDVFSTGPFYAAVDPIQTQSDYSFDLPWVVKGSSAFESFHEPETRFYAHQATEPDTTIRVVLPA